LEGRKFRDVNLYRCSSDACTGIAISVQEGDMWRRSPAVAGSFYPSDPEKLAREIAAYLKDAEREKREIRGDIFGLIVPHAGYMYSGPVAAHSYARLAGSGVGVAVVLAPCHRARFQGGSVIPEGVFETPLGDVAIDASIGKALEKQAHIKFIKEVHLEEHSLEVQVPFLQVVLGDFTLVPVIIGTTDLPTCKMIAAEIAEVLASEKRRFVVVISTDLSHYHHYEKAKKIDGRFIDRLKSFDINALHESLSSDESQACGEGPVITGLELGRLMGSRSVEILKYANSGDTAGGKGQVVGYLAAALVR
jgi:AmmeMemoRadiSam system protein B